MQFGLVSGRKKNREGNRFGFTLIELLVVVGIIAVLLAILLPTLGKAKETARTAHCQSGLRQWGFAVYYYLNDYNQYLPQEGASGGNTDPNTWYNELPGYVNCPKYGDIYTGAVVDGYKNTWIWYCQTQLLIKKNSGSDKNSFHYTWNAVLNGTGTWTPNFGPAPYNLNHIKATVINEPMNTVLMAETDNNVPNEGPSAGSLARKRHQTKGENFMFMDAHVEFINASDNVVPTGDAAGSVTTWNTRQWNSNTGRRLVWGPFKN